MSRDTTRGIFNRNVSLPSEDGSQSIKLGLERCRGQMRFLVHELHRHFKLRKSNRCVRGALQRLCHELKPKSV